MRWDDSWGQANCDLDLFLVRYNDLNSEWVPVAADTQIQDGNQGSIPSAGLKIDQANAGNYQLVIQKERCPNNPAWIQLTAWIEDDLQYYSAGHHMGSPEESRNSGMLAVGATHYWNTNAIAPYSSRGPTLDGRTKPDITGIDCALSTASTPGTLNGNQCWFPGTSQAAPHVAGLAVLMRQRFPHYSPTETVRYLQQHASDRGTAGADHTWGQGLATLPVSDAVGPATNVTTGPFNEGGVIQVNWDTAPGTLLCSQRDRLHHLRGQRR